MVYPTEGRQGKAVHFVQNIGRGGVRTSNPLVVPERAKAILVICSFRYSRMVHKLIVDINGSQGEMPPVIVLLLEEDGEWEPNNAIMAQDAFLKAGADEIILCTPDSNLNSLVSLSLVRITRTFDLCRSLEDIEVAVREQAKKIAYLHDRHHRMFFKCVHRIVPNLTEMRSNIAGQPAPGFQVDSLRFLDRLGRGSFGEVYLADNLDTGRREAIKAMDKQRMHDLSDIVNISNEVRVLSLVRGHRNVVEITGMVHGRDHFFICMDYAGPTSLFRAIKSAGGILSVGLAQSFSAQIVDALKFCHDQGVAHRDLKPENICVDEEETFVKIVDFGCAIRTSSSRLPEGPCGTMPFMAPEVMDNRNYEARGVDVWAWGVNVLEMLCGVGKLGELMGWPRNVAPSKDRALDLAAFFETEEALKPTLRECFGNEVPDALIEVLAGALSADPSERWKAADVCKSNWVVDGLPL